MDVEQKTPLWERIVLWLLIAIGVIIVMLLVTLVAQGQQTMAPFKTQQINTTYYVGQASYTTIQKAVTAACAAPGARVVIPAGVTPSDTIGAAAGCATAPIVDQRALPDVCYAWSGSGPYTATGCVDGTGGTPGGSDTQVQVNVAGSFGTDELFVNNATTHNVKAGGLQNSYNSDQFNTGNNGVATLQGLGENDIMIPYGSATTENIAAAVVNNGTHVQDRQNGAILDYFFNSHPGEQDHTSMVPDCTDTTDPVGTRNEGGTCLSIAQSVYTSGQDSSGTPTEHNGLGLTVVNGSPGIRQGLVMVQEFDGGDDNTGVAIFQNSRSNQSAASSEGNLGISWHGTEDAAVTGTVVTGGHSATSLVVSMGNGAGANLPVVSTGEVYSSGFITGLTAGSGRLLHSFSTSDNTHAVSSGIVLLTAACGALSNQNNPISTSCTYTNSGSIATGDLCVTGLWNGATCSGGTAYRVMVGDYQDPECATVTAAGGGSVTLGLTFPHPSGTPIYQGANSCGQVMIGRGSAITGAIGTPNFIIAGARTNASYDYIFEVLQGQNGNVQMPLQNLSFSIGSYSRTGSTVTLAMGGPTSQIMNNYTPPAGATVCVTGTSIDECGIATVASGFSGGGGFLTYTSGSSGTASGSGGTLAVLDASTETYNGLANYTVDCAAYAIKVDPNIGLTLAPNNCDWAASAPFVQPNSYSQVWGGQRILMDAVTPNPIFNPSLLTLSGIGAAFSGGVGICFQCDSSEPVTDFIGYGGTEQPLVMVNSTAPAVGTYFMLGNAPINGGDVIRIGTIPAGGTGFTAYNLLDMETVADGVTLLQFDDTTGNLRLFNLTTNAASLETQGLFSDVDVVAGRTVQAGTQLVVGNGSDGIAAQSIITNQSFIAPGRSFANGIYFNFDGAGVAEASITYNLGSFSPLTCDMYVDVDKSGTDAIDLQSDCSGTYTEFLNGTLNASTAVVTPSASVLTTTTTNDLAMFDNTTGHLADSGVLKGALVYLNVANQFGNFTQTFGLTGSGENQISNAEIVGINTSSATTFTLNNLTGNIDAISFSVGGTAGFNGTCTVLATVVNGIITSC